MIITNNNGSTKSVIGIYRYSDSAVYEKGDFVIYDGMIYRCNAVSSSSIYGKIPSEDTVDFSIYLGDKIATSEEYYNYINNDGESEDKYISMFTLSEILQKMYFGLDDCGVIKDYYSDSDDYSISSVDDLDSSLSPLDAIISYKTLNNGILKVSRDLEELETILSDSEDGKGKSYYSPESIEDDNSFVILKQYTYDGKKSSTDSDYIRYRVQELIDPVYGNTYYRFAKGTINSSEEWEFNTISSWLNTFSGDQSSLNKIRAVDSYLLKLKNDYTQKLNSIKGSFKFRTINFTPGKSLTFSKSSLGGTDLSDTSKLITIIVTKKLTSGINQKFSATFDILDAANNGNTYKLYISDDCFATISIDSSESSITITLTETKDSYELSNLYYQFDYND